MSAREITLTDARSLRAIAHPLRLTLLGLLRREGPLTATRAAELVGESSGATSYHLRQLARHGLVEDAGGGRGRERPWRATAQYTSWSAVTDDTEVREAAQALERLVLARYLERAEKWLETRRDAPTEWQEAAGFGDAMLYLTSAELAELERELRAMIERYEPRTADPARRPPGARRVDFIRLVLPAGE